MHSRTEGHPILVRSDTWDLPCGSLLPLKNSSPLGSVVRTRQLLMSWFQGAKACEGGNAEGEEGEDGEWDVQGKGKGSDDDEEGNQGSEEGGEDGREDEDGDAEGVAVL